MHNPYTFAHTTEGIEHKKIPFFSHNDNKKILLRSFIFYELKVYLIYLCMPEVSK